ncbi:MAG TPA: antibiotic biosynthesis monooxygenase [Deltaproteobacteria bacterium]|nr:antibiotic biosynthesis monooxygenase [Deltaproteobacteria bacterium]
MVHVVASVRVKKGKVAEYLEIFRDLIPAVREEQGCVEYFPAIDIPTELPVQECDEHTVTILETWASLESLYDHLRTAHYLAYRERVKDIVEHVSLKVLKKF